MAIAHPAQRRARAPPQTAAASVSPAPSRTARCNNLPAHDVAILPYRLGEPTRSGSATRFYEHVAACRPMLATPDVAELQTKQTLVSLASDANAFISKLNELQAAQFHDGHERARWLACRHETWEQRTQTLLDVLQRKRY